MLIYINISLANPLWITSFGSQGTGDGQFNDPVIISKGSNGKIFVSDKRNHRIVVLFDPKNWKVPDTISLDTLVLDEDLTLNRDYNMIIQHNDNSNSGNGNFSIINNKTLTLASGSGIQVDSLELNNGHLVMNQDMSLNMPITLNDLGNSLDVGTNNVLSLAGIISGTGKLAKQGSGTLTLSGTNTYSGGTNLCPNHFFQEVISIN